MKVDSGDIDGMTDGLQRHSHSVLCHWHVRLSPPYYIGYSLTSIIDTEFEAWKARAGGERVPRRDVGRYDTHVGGSDALWRLASKGSILFRLEYQASLPRVQSTRQDGDNWTDASSLPH